MRSVQVFILFLVIGAAAAVLYGRVSGPAGPEPIASVTAARKPGSSAAADGMAPKGSQPTATAAVVPNTPVAAPHVARPEPTDVETAQAKAARLAAKETYTRAQIHSLLQTSMQGKLSDRELTPSDYDRLADAILRIRASQRVLQGIGESDPGSEVRSVYSDTLKGAFEELQQITGVPPSGWGDVLAGQEPAENSGEDVGRTQ